MQNTTITKQNTKIVENDNTITNLEHIDASEQIQHFYITNCKNFQSLSGIHKLQKSLESLHVTNTSLTSTIALEQLQSAIFTEIELVSNKQLTQIEGIFELDRNLPNVKVAILRENALESIAGIGPLRFLEHLDVSSNQLSDLHELRYLQNFPYCKYVNCRNNPFCNQCDFENTLKFCVSRRSIKTLLYKSQQSDALTQEELNQIYQTQEKPLSNFKQHELTCIDYHRILLTEWDLQDAEERDLPLHNQLESAEEQNEQMVAQLKKVREDQTYIQSQLVEQDLQYQQIVDELLQIENEHDQFIKHQKEQIVNLLTPVRDQ